MAKEKNSSDTPTPKKSAAKKSPAKKAAAKKPAVAQFVASAAGNESQLSTSSVHKTQPAPAELQEEIRLRAYEIYRQRGGQHGLHDADWHRAEAEVRSKY